MHSRVTSLEARGGSQAHGGPTSSGLLGAQGAESVPGQHLMFEAHELLQSVEGREFSRD